MKKDLLVQSCGAMVLLMAIGATFLVRRPNETPAGEVPPSSDPKWAKRTARIPAIPHEGHPAPHEKDSRQIVAEHAVTDPEHAIRYANSIPDLNLRATLMGIIADTWSKHDPDAAFEWASLLANPNEKSSALTGVILSLIATGKPEKALSFISSTPGGEFKDDMIVYGILGLSAVDPNQTASMISSLSGQGAIAAAVSTLTKEISVSGHTGLLDEILRAMTPGSAREALAGAVVREMAKSDPEGALNWQLVHSEPSNLVGFRGVASAFALRDPLRGMELGSQLSNPKDRAAFLDLLGAAWGRADPAGASEWMLEQTNKPEYSTNNDGFEGIISEAVQYDHEEIFNKLDGIKDDAVRSEITQIAYSNLSKFDPATAAKNFMNSDDPAPQSSMVNTASTITSNWLAKDPSNATAWVAELSGGPIKDAAIGEVIHRLLQGATANDETQMNRWIAQISDPQKKKSMADAIKASGQK